MIALIVVAGYLLAAGLMAAASARCMAQDCPVDAADWAVAGIIGLIWPLVLLLYLPVFIARALFWKGDG